jgi:DNA-binding response OmpR family regulator
MATILLIDDEENYVNLLTVLLRARNHAVIAVLDSREALLRFEDIHQSVDLVILDLNMPHLSGRKVYEGLRKINPDIVVVFNSGDEMESVMAELPEIAGLHYLRKPFPIDELHETIDTALRVSVS